MASRQVAGVGSMTDFSKLSDAELNLAVSKASQHAEKYWQDQFGQWWQESENGLLQRTVTQYTENGLFCFERLKENQMQLTTDNIPSDEPWTAQAFACDGESKQATNPNLNRAILECWLQLNEAHGAMATFSIDVEYQDHANEFGVSMHIGIIENMDKQQVINAVANHFQDNPETYKIESWPARYCTVKTGKIGLATNEDIEYEITHEIIISERIRG